MSYVFSKALQHSDDDKERRSSVPPKWQTVAPAVNARPKVPPPVARKPSTGAPPAQGTSTAQPPKAFRKTSLPARMHSVDDFGTGPKMGGAFARLQANLEKPDDGEKGAALYSEVYDAYRVKKALKEHGCLPKDIQQDARVRKYSFDKAPPVVLPKPRRPSADSKRDVFARNRSLTSPTTPTANTFPDDNIFHKNTRSPSLEDTKSLESSIAEANNSITTSSQPPSSPKSPFGNHEEIKKLESSHEVKVMKEEIIKEKHQQIESQRKLSETIDELESISFDELNHQPLVEEPEKEKAEEQEENNVFGEDDSSIATSERQDDSSIATSERQDDTSIATAEVEQVQNTEEKIVQIKTTDEEKAVQVETTDDEKVVQVETTDVEKVVQNETTDEKVVKIETTDEGKVIQAETNVENIVQNETTDEKVVKIETTDEGKVVQAETTDDEKVVQVETLDDEKIVQVESNDDKNAQVENINETVVKVQVQVDTKAENPNETQINNEICENAKEGTITNSESSQTPATDSTEKNMIETKTENDETESNDQGACGENNVVKLEEPVENNGDYSKESPTVENSGVNAQATVEISGDNIKAVIENTGDNTQAAVETSGDNTQELVENSGDNTQESVENKNIDTLPLSSESESKEIINGNVAIDNVPEILITHEQSEQSEQKLETPLDKNIGESVEQEVSQEENSNSNNTVSDEKPLDSSPVVLSTEKSVIPEIQPEIDEAKQETISKQPELNNNSEANKNPIETAL